MRKLFLLGIVIFIAGVTVFWGVYYWKNLRGVGPVVLPPPEKIEDTLPPARNNTEFPLKLPDGFSISLFAKDLPGARVMLATHGHPLLGFIAVSQTSQGKVTFLDDQGKVVDGLTIENLRKPHGLARDPLEPFEFYIAEEHRISRIALYSDGFMEKIADLPAGGGHFTRTLGFGPDGRLYVSIGSSCNVCNEKDERRAKIYSMNKDGSDFEEFARGLRNAVFFAWHPKTQKIWATEMGRDELGDDLPPDEIDIVESGPSTKLRVNNYGWPICYGRNVHDTDFDKNTYIRNPCEEPFEIPSYIDIPAHSAPLGLAFIPATESWPKEYWHDLLVAYHGSWNRSVPTGYKIVRFKLDENGISQGVEDFISGWLTRDNRALGRPVDILVQPDGMMYISDDKAGVIYKVTYKP